MSDATRWVRAGVVLAIVGLGWLGGCSDSPGGVGRHEEYRVTLWDLTAGSEGSNDSVYARFEVEVSDGTRTRIEGAVVRFRVSSGTVTPETTTSGVDGLAGGVWTFEGIMGGPGPSVYLSACASNSKTRCDMYATLLEIGLRTP